MKKIIFSLIFFFSCIYAHATTVTFSTGSGGSYDAEMNDFSTNEHVEAGNLRGAKADYYAIVYFNISSIPSNATVSSATLTFNIVETDNSGGNMGLYEILDPNSTGAGSTMTWCGSNCDVYNSHATYQDKITETPIKWDTAGDNVNSSNIISLISNSSAISVNYTGPLSFTVTTAVQGWITISSSNIGFLTKVGNLGDPSVRYNGYLGGTPPSLSVTYTLPSSPTTYTTINRVQLNNAAIN